MLAKAALTLLALGIGVLVVRSRGHRFDVPARRSCGCSGSSACTVLGAAADGRLVPTLVLAVACLLVLLIVAVLMSTYRPQDVLHAVIVVFGILVVVATLTTLVLGTHRPAPWRAATAARQRARLTGGDVHAVGGRAPVPR